MPKNENTATEFQAFCPIEFLQKGDERRFQGFITTEHPDRENEIVLQDGLDFSEFLKLGYFNDNHSKATGDVLGYPLKVEKRTTPDGKRGHWVEGRLLKGYGPADRVWDLAMSLKKEKAPRQIGFSLQGSVLRRLDAAGRPVDMTDENEAKRQGKIIAKAIVRHVAITPSPVNPYTGMEALVKSLTAGADIAAPATPQAGSGFALRTESLDGVSYNQADQPQKAKKKRKQHTRHGLTKSQAISLLHEHGYEGERAENIWRLAKALKHERQNNG
jgi:hypothetical protein